jgi:hypothetical protein
MAQTGYTPILIYSSNTASQAPTAGNLTNSTLGSELAINITDGKLFYKDNANVVQVIGWKTVPTTAGGTGLTSYVSGDLLYYATGTTLTRLGIGAANTVLTSSGTAPQWSSALSITGLTNSGNLTFTGTGNRITGDFSNATLSNRVAFQTSTTNGNTNIYSLPNGTSTTAAFSAVNNPDPTNAGFTQLLALSTESSLRAAISGSGTYLPITFYTSGLERLRIDTTGRFGFGTSSPNINSLQTLQFEAGTLDTSITAISYGAVNPTIRLRSAGGTAASPSASTTNPLNILGGTTSDGTTFFNTIAITGFILGTPTAGSHPTGILFSTTPSGSTSRVEAVRIHPSRGVSIGDTTDPGAGNLRLGTGNLVIGTSGKGIDFSATPGTGTSELLADYEEGTWTPTIASNTGTITSYTSSGSYTKVGRQVTLIFTFKITNNGTGAGFIRITNLPFNVITGNSAGTGAEFAAVGYQTVAYVGSSTQINMFKYDWTYPGGLNHEFYVTITYQN